MMREGQIGVLREKQTDRRKYRRASKLSKDGDKKNDEEEES